MSRRASAGNGGAILYRQTCPQLNEGGAALFHKFAKFTFGFAQFLFLLFKIGSERLKINRLTGFGIEEKEECEKK